MAFSQGPTCSARRNKLRQLLQRLIARAVLIALSAGALRHSHVRWHVRRHARPLRLLHLRTKNRPMTQYRAALSTRMFVVQEIAELCQVSERTVWRWIRNKELNVHHFRRLTRISEKDFENFLRRNRK